MSLQESIIEDISLDWIGELGYAVGQGPQLAPCEQPSELGSFSDVVLVGRLREAIRRLKRAIPPRTPSSLRGTLRPKLLSGELSVS